MVFRSLLFLNPKAGILARAIYARESTDDKQHEIFVDPKGIRNIGSSDPKVLLNSSIISSTLSHTEWLFWGMDKKAISPIRESQLCWLRPTVQ